MWAEIHCENCFGLFLIKRGDIEKKMREDYGMLCKDCRELLDGENFDGLSDRKNKYVRDFE